MGEQMCMLYVDHLTEENRTSAVAVSFLQPLVQSYISWWKIDSVLAFPEQDNHHKNEEKCLSTAKDS